MIQSVNTPHSKRTNSAYLATERDHDERRTRGEQALEQISISLPDRCSGEQVTAPSHLGLVVGGAWGMGHVVEMFQMKEAPKLECQ